MCWPISSSNGPAWPRWGCSDARTETMTFLQPFILLGLPLILLPVVIHLLNRLRHRPQPWAAMRFLLTATRSSTGHAKLRQFLILLFRVLALLTLLLFLARPLAGGWLGWALAPAPDAIVILLDRSASMETKLSGATMTRRQQALKLLSEAGKEFEESSHLILIDSALRAPQEIKQAASLTDSPLTGPTDTAADMPALFQSAVNWLIENKAGTAELWVASDLQRGNWQPEDSRWKNVIAQLEALPQKVRVRLLKVGEPRDGNASVSLREVSRRQRGEKGEVLLAVDFQRAGGAGEPLPVGLTLDGVKTSVEVALEGQALRWRHRAELGARKNAGWGMLELPADLNARDNTAYFVYGPETPLRATVVATDPEATGLFRLAGAIFEPGARRDATEATIEQAATSLWTDDTLIVWQAPLPGGATAERLRKFIEEGGEVIFFPPGVTDAGRFEGVGWGEVQNAEGERGYRIIRWDEDQGPLAKTDEGLSLPVAQTTFLRRQIFNGHKNVLAAFEDGTPFLARQSIGRGEAVFCASLPKREWSSLADGPVLVPMLQRLLQTGGRRLQQTAAVVCGELGAADEARQWTPVDSATARNIRTQAGVYRSGERLLAVNRPMVEDEPEILEEPAARQLFGTLPLQTLQERQGRTGGLQGEIWRVFLFGMLLFLVAEGFLMLPARAPTGVTGAGAPARPSKNPRPEEVAS